ncbi:MAG: glycoside hydrolase [Gammaproteobacteria bacterium]|nr:glycoside hydrolase [Gammaproteobacteria bacterium]MDH4313215.1 glycoside hydrolase [Gammaproteobacteria bacterium]MDH5213579.1 glycoside hydrolase [Gammaproteobacteria bacterium]MDH5501450.1 glycoside hydrolase [Gammaproteobacteria bacterium]
MHRYLLRLALLPVASLVSACGDAPQETVAVEFLPVSAATGSAEPHLSLTVWGEAVLSWLEPDGDGVALRVSTLGEDAWQEPVTVASGDNWFVNWADFPSVVPISDTLWAAHWLARRPGGVYSYDVAIAVSGDAGQSWGQPVTPHDDGTATEHGFVTLFAWDESVGAIWLDGRNMAASDVNEGHGKAGADAHGSGMTLRSAIIGTDGSIRKPQLVDELVCDCCQTDVAIAANGPVAVYRNRTIDEIRDIHVISARGGTWQIDTAVADDGWKIAACPVNGPAISARENNVAVAWFTAAGDDTQVQMAWSSDAGESFGAPIDIDVGRPIGRVDVELLEDDVAVVSWLRMGDNDEGEICLRQVNASGNRGPVRIIATTGANRMSGFPQMVRQRDGLILAWTDTRDPESRVVSARVDSASLKIR